MSETIIGEHSSQHSPTLKAIPCLRATPLSSTLAFQRDPLGFLTALVHEYGDIVQFRLLHLPVVVINHPNFVRQVLLENFNNYDKDVFMFSLLRPAMGDGLITSVGGESWLRQRRLMQPAFHRRRIANLGKLMTDLTLERLQYWEARVTQGQSIDMTEEMRHLTLQIVSKSLFSIDISDQSSVFGNAFAEANHLLAAFARFPFPPLNFPTPSHLRLWGAIRRMDKIAFGIIQQRRQINEDLGDLLSLLVAAKDEETGEGMSDQQLRDEVMSFLIAGHETSTDALSWVWYLLSQYPDVEHRLHSELDSVLAGRVPTTDDLPLLPYTRMVVDESIRLYPPVWQLMRRAREEDVIDGYRIPAGMTLFWSQYLLHRHPAFWSDPERFDPDRFLDEHVAKRDRFAYAPFGGGPRICLGSNFAMTEMLLILATIAQKYRLVLDPPQHLEPVASMALRPKNGVSVRLVRR
jgi:cytochrome P450